MASIRVEKGSKAGTVINLTKNLTTIGQAGQHCAVIAKRSNGYFITHVLGNEQPRVNGEKVSTTPRQLVHHDVIEIGAEKLYFFYANDAA